MLAYFHPSQEIDILCDASNVAVRAVLVHRYPNGSEPSITNAPKTLSVTQQHYSQIKKDGLPVVFALKTFHQYRYGRSFIPVTDHKPLVAMFGLKKGTPGWRQTDLYDEHLYEVSMTTQFNTGKLQIMATQMH